MSMPPPKSRTAATRRIAAWGREQKHGLQHRRHAGTDNDPGQATPVCLGQQHIPRRGQPGRHQLQPANPSQQISIRHSTNNNRGSARYLSTAAPTDTSPEVSSPLVTTAAVIART